jgi:hypothetical protein
MTNAVGCSYSAPPPLQHNHGGSDADWGNATPDREESGKETLEYVSDGLRGRYRMTSLPAGMLTGVVQRPAKRRRVAIVV